MKLKIFFGVVVSMLLMLSAFAILYDGTPSHNQQYVNPASTSSAYQLNVTINADGSITNGTAISHATNSNLYALNGNLNGTLTILANNSVFNGAGYTINALLYDKGITASNVTEVTVSNLSVVNATYGVNISNSNNIWLKNVTTTASDAGVSIYNASSINISKGNFTGGQDGLDITNSSSIWLSNSNITGTADCGLYPVNVQYLHSFNDTYLGHYYDTYIDASSFIYFAEDNLSVSEYGAYIVYSQNVYVSYSNLSSDSGASVFAEYSGLVNLSYDDFNNSLVASGYAAFVEYGYDAVYIFHDSINTSNYALYADESTYGGVIKESTIRASEVVYFDYSSQLVVIDDNTVTLTNNGGLAYCDETNSNIIISNNTVTGRGTASYGVDLEGYFAYNVVVEGNTFTNLTYPVYAVPYAGESLVVSGNAFENTHDAVTWYYFANVTVSNNLFENTTDEAIINYYSANTYIYDNSIVNTSNYAIDVEYCTGGLEVFGNTIYNNASGAEGIYFYYDVGGQIFNNTIENIDYGVDIEYSGNAQVFNNFFFNDSYSIYDEYNWGISYFDNTVVNSTSNAFYSYESGNLSVYANTFKNATYSVLYVMYAGNFIFYHNNVINSSMINVTLQYNVNIAWNSSLPVGGNYWSTYSGTGSNGIGTTPYILDSSDVDHYPLTSLWKQPSITFSESGLAAGSLWSVTFGGTTISSAGTSISFAPSAAEHITVRYSVAGMNGFSITNGTGNVSLNGSDQSISVTFSQVTYDISFAESGLPLGTVWTINLNQQSKNSTEAQIGFSLPNGTYTFTVGNVPGYKTSISGSLTVNGSAKNVSIEFVEITYTVIIYQNGLPANHSWTFMLNGKNYSTNTSSVTVYLASGTYNLSVNAPSGYWTTAPSAVTVNNGNATVFIAFEANSSASGAGITGTLMGMGIGLGAVFGAAAGIIGYMVYMGTGPFSQFRKKK